MPSNNLAICLVESNLSKLTLMIAVRGAASKTPIITHIIPQKIKDKIIVIWCNPKASPKIFGSTKLPIIWLIIAGRNIINKTEDKSGYCKIAIGIGNSTAIMEPTTGIKFKINVKEPKIIASSKPKNQ